MYGHPADREYANQCLRLWGVRQRYGGPAGYPRDAAFIPKAKGIPVEWHDNITETIGVVVTHCLDAHDRMLVKMYYEPYPDKEKNGEMVACNRSLVLRRCKEKGIKVSRSKFDDAISCAIGRVAMALAYPSMICEPPEQLDSGKKVCNLHKSPVRFAT